MVILYHTLYFIIPNFCKQLYNAVWIDRAVVISGKQAPVGLASLPSYLQNRRLVGVVLRSPESIAETD